MADLLDSLLGLLDLEEIDLDLYRGQNEEQRWGRLFGGQVAAQSLVAAGRTVEGWLAHSLHAYFLRPGDSSITVLCSVDRIRDGRSCRSDTYASDMSLIDTAMRPHGRRGELGPVMMASLDHALWFHHPSRFDEWPTPRRARSPQARAATRATSSTRATDASSPRSPRRG